FYIGDLLEEEITNGKSKRVHYIQAAGQVVAIRTTGNDNYLRYLHKDHLGSVTLVTDEHRNPVQFLAYDAWGMRRTAGSWVPFTQSFPANTGNTHNLQDPSRGFTFHEHLEIGDFIHMNARVYDPSLGKFLSPDQFIQFGDNLQSYNRYTYVLNNPLILTDPSGNIAVGFIIGGLVAGFIASTVTSQILSSLGINGVANALISAAAGFAASFAVAAANPVSSGGTASSSAAGSSATNFSFGDLAIELFQSAAPFIDEDLGKIVSYGGYVKSAVSLADGLSKTQKAGSNALTSEELEALSGLDGAQFVNLQETGEAALGLLNEVEEFLPGTKKAIGQQLKDFVGIGLNSNERLIQSISFDDFTFEELELGLPHAGPLVFQSRGNNRIVLLTLKAQTVNGIQQLSARASIITPTNGFGFIGRFNRANVKVLQFAIDFGKEGAGSALTNVIAHELFAERQFGRGNRIPTNRNSLNINNARLKFHGLGGRSSSLPRFQERLNRLLPST
ncbi:MAG: RHS repeat-associated core domain-containing protein, partial [Bacteroidota bacterium]